MVDQPQEVWPFLETGRYVKTFDKIAELGAGGFGTVSKVRHKLDGRVYALKTIKMHIQFDPHCEKPIAQHPAMKEIDAISKLSHENIVGYKGCWVEADEPDCEHVKRILSKMGRRRGRVISIGDGIDESDEDDSDFALSAELERDVEVNAFNERAQLNESSSDGDLSSETE